MQKNYKFSVLDEKYKEEIVIAVDEILQTVIEYYKNNRYEVTITGVTYTSDAIARESKVKFDYSSTSPYPAIEIKFSNLGSAFRTPKQRLLDGVFVLKNATKEFTNDLYNQHGVTSLFLVGHNEKKEWGTPSEKTQDLLDQAHERLEAWRG